MTRDPLAPSALFAILRRWISSMQIFPREKIRDLFSFEMRDCSFSFLSFLFSSSFFFFRPQLNGKFRSLPIPISSSFVLHTYSWIDNVDSRFVPSPALKFFPFRVFHVSTNTGRRARTALAREFIRPTSVIFSD